MLSFQRSLKSSGALARKPKKFFKKKKTTSRSRELRSTESQKKALLSLYTQSRYYESETLARSLIEKHPDDFFTWNIFGAVLRQQSRLRESLTAFQEATKLAPNDANARNNLSVTLQELGRLEEAEASYRKTLELRPDLAAAHYNLANTLRHRGKLAESKDSFERAIALKPDFVDAHYSVGTILKVMGRLVEAKNSYNQVIEIEPDNAMAHCALGTIFKEMGRFDEAITSQTKAIAASPAYATAHYNLGNTLRAMGRYGEAETRYREAISLDSDNASAQNSLLVCLFNQNKRSLFYEHLDDLVANKRANAVVGSLTARAALKYDVERPNIFCGEPLKYVLHADLKDKYDFKKLFSGVVADLLQSEKVSLRSQPLLTNGHQTFGNLFDIETEATAQIQKTIRSEVENYRSYFLSSGEGLIKEWPSDYDLYGWLISMKSGGNLAPHIHDEGWLSGSIYINIPPKTKAGSGNLVVALGEEVDAADNTSTLQKKNINVFTGSMVLFPASLTHYTTPFESDEDRVVLAFDVKPK
jgi:tetratricopeptide (TPR) repeat protein